MAGDAVNGRVRPDQREAILVGAYRLHRHIPAEYGVTLLAVCPELATMDVGVTVSTLRAYVTEYRFGMALDAIDLRMHAPQGIAGRIVVEFGNGADRFPTRLCVAILAGNGQGAVWAARLRIGRTTILSEDGSLDDEHEREQENERRHYPLEHERHALLGPR
jgi:hypothetical protein